MNKLSNIKEEVIDLFLKGISTIKLSKIYKCDPMTVSKLLIENNINTVYILDNFKEKIINEYNSGDSSVVLSKRYNLTPTSIIKNLKRWGLCTRGVQESSRLYTCNSTYFSNIDTSNKSYFLGLLYADGHIRKDCNSVVLKIKDLDCLEKFKADMESSYPIKYTLIENGKYNIYVYHVTDGQIKKDLNSFGLETNKAEFTGFPNIKYEYYSDFIRGYFDGDGTIGEYRYNQKYKNKSHNKTYRRFSLLGNESLLNTIKNYFLEELGIKFNKLVQHSQTYFLKTLTYSKKEDLIKIYNLLYKNTNNSFMNRKYKIFSSIVLNIQGK